MSWKIGKFILLIFICTVYFASSPISAESDGQDVNAGILSPLSGPNATLSQNIDEYMTALADAGRFSGAVLAGRGDTVLLSKGYGMANQEFSVPNRPDTVFPIGSNTKQLTAAAIMKLQEQGKLKITDPVTLYIPDATNWKDIRIYQLLNHTAGIQSDGGFAINDPENLSLPEIINRISVLSLTFEPGTNYTYSNNGYITLSYIIEKASGMSYEDYLKTNIFEPLGMNSTGQDNARDVFPNRSSGYTTMDGKHIHYDLQNIHNTYGAGSIHSTIEDLYKWERAFTKPGIILNQNSTDAMIDNKYGIEKIVQNNQNIIFHSGRNFGFISHTQHFSDGDVTLIFLSNHDRTPMATLPKDLSAILYEKPYSLPKKVERKAVPLTEEERANYSGTFEPVWEKSWTITVYPDGNRLFYDSVMPKETVELFYEGNDTFFVTPESNDSFFFTRNDNGDVNGLKMYTMEGNYDLLNKVP